MAGGADGERRRYRCRVMVVLLVLVRTDARAFDSRLSSVLRPFRHRSRDQRADM